MNKLTLIINKLSKYMLNIKIHVNICQTFLLPNETMTLQCRASSCTHVHQWKHAASVCSSNAALKPESRV